MTIKKNSKPRHINPKRYEGRIPSRKRLIALGLFEDKCAKCGKREGELLPNGKKAHLTKDHIIPIGKGGKDEISNIQLLCYDCNQAKADKIL